MKATRVWTSLATALLLFTWQGNANTFTVSNLNDNGSGSLRAAIASANANFPVQDTINISVTGRITLTSGHLLITDGVVINGPGAKLLTVSGNGSSRVFTDTASTGASSTVISGLRIARGSATNGGAIYYTGASTINMTFTLNDCEIDSCSATSDGGAIYANHSGPYTTMNLNNCTLKSNSAGNNGGGMLLSAGIKPAVMTNCTLSGNSATAAGGGLYQLAFGTSVDMINCTVTNNSATGWGGGVYLNQIIGGGPCSPKNTIIAGNGGNASSPDVYGTFTSLGHNLIGKTDGSTGWVASDLKGTIASPLNPMVSPIADNGGQTLTHALLLGSPAINAGDTTGAPLNDQRGYFRDANTDIGAFEYGAALPIQLATFTATLATANAVHLTWTTVTETNNYGFYIQRRASIEQDFAELPNSFVAGHGTTLQPQHYTYTDASVTSGSWSYRLKQIDLDGTVHYTDPVSVNVLTDVKDGARPTAFALEQNYPNPFNPSTVVSYQLPVASYVTLKVYTLLGQEVVTLIDEQQQPGPKSVKLNASGLASGVYLYRLTAGSYSETKRLALVK